MVSPSRKQREIAERQELILDVARQMLLERGYLGLTMDRVAAATEYSKGTIYQHFPNKEDLVASLAIQTGEKRALLFERAATFRGRPRERLAAIGEAAELFHHLYPDHANSENVIRTASIRDKTSAAKVAALQGCEFRCMNISAGLVRDGVAQGDLVLPETHTPEELIFGLWSMHIGTMCALSWDKDLSVAGISDPLDTLRRNYNAYLDGFDWKPLSTEWDYGATLERVRQEIFPEEVRRARSA